MDSKMKEKSFQEALENCASEPVHIPGLVQPFACLIGVDPDTNRIGYASENCAAFLGVEASELLGADLRTCLGTEFIHELNNASARPGFSERSMPVGTFKFNNIETVVFAFSSNGTHVIQFEPAQESGLGSVDALGTLSFLVREVQSCEVGKPFFDQTTKLLRHLSGYDRVMIYKFDAQFNGEVLAEACPKSMQPFVGLRFPQWDIPAQAREIMCKLPLRFIMDVDQVPVPLQAGNATLPPLDITLADCRGVSPIHLEYLRNMGTRASMTLSVVVEGALWGIISFHHRRCRVPSQTLRDVLVAFQDLFSTKLASIRKQAQLDMVRKTDKIKDSTLDEIDGEEVLEKALVHIGSVVEDVLQAAGMYVVTGSKTVSYGLIPGPEVLSRLCLEMQSCLGEAIVSDNLSARYPELKPVLNGCAGVFAMATAKDRSLCIFRREVATTVSWAGSPEKTIELKEGKSRLAPRASFSTYLDDVKDSSAAWTEEDVYFAERVWILFNSAERRALKNTLNRQQAIMINELNHRVRNILALVRSVSRQAQRHNGSLDSYAASLESRIQALAAAHDISSGTAIASADTIRLIQTETDPYQSNDRIQIHGRTQYLRAEIAPIFSLVIHELATNAVKYGSLSVAEGTLDILLEEAEGGIVIKWCEAGGPPVTVPNERGFGSALIEQAVPHEMGGSAELRFERAGLVADLFIPDDVFENEPNTVVLNSASTKAAITTKRVVPFDPAAIDGFMLVVEDNFVIANDMKDQLEKSGIKVIEICSNSEDALEVLSSEPPSFAILDVNLGGGNTSEPVANRLLKLGVPFLFVTGYGNNAELANSFDHVPRLTKPVATNDLQVAIMDVLNRKTVKVDQS